MARRVVVTGMGLVTPIGNDLTSTWDALLAGTSGAAPITHFDAGAFATRFACEVKGWDPSPWFSPEELRDADHFLQYGVAAAMMALADAGLGRAVPPGCERRWGCYLGAGLGSVRAIEESLTAVRERAPGAVFSPGFLPHTYVSAIPSI